jgi:8-oxo-dGTP pyrophosphatase MutT (NUDIX family)
MDLWRRLKALPPVAEPDKARAAVLIPLYADGQSVRVVLTKRPDDMRTHPGDVVFPGGMMENGERPIDAAIREAEEEVALPPEAVVEVLGGLSPLTTRDLDRLIVPVVARIERPAELIPDPSEVEVIIEPTLAELLDESQWHTQDWMGHTLWFYQFREGTLWGATAFMVRELLTYLRGER